MVADKACDADALPTALNLLNAKAVIPPKSNRRVQQGFDRHQYKHRNPIERFFCRIKQFRSSATRYDKLASRFASFIALAARFIWLACCQQTLAHDAPRVQVEHRSHVPALGRPDIGEVGHRAALALVLGQASPLGPCPQAPAHAWAARCGAAPHD